MRSFSLARLFFVLLLIAFIANVVLVTVFISISASTSSILSRNDVAPVVDSLSRIVDAMRKENEARALGQPVEVLSAGRDRLRDTLTLLGSAGASAPETQRKAQQVIESVAADLARVNTQFVTAKVRTDAELSELSSRLELLAREAGRLLETPGVARHIGWDRALSVLSVLFSWPSIVFVILFVILFTPSGGRRFSELFSQFQSVKLFGAEFAPLPDVKASTEEGILEYRKKVQQQYDAQVREQALRQILNRVVEEVQKEVQSEPRGFRFPADTRYTVHVPDILFAETLYQLLDYFPSGGGRGRAWSVRFGLIGRSWRLNESITQGEVPTQDRALIADWGMTKEEARRAGQGRQSFSSTVLQTANGIYVGIFYMDSKQPHAFETSSGYEELHAKIKLKCDQLGLTTALDRIRGGMSGKAPEVEIYSNYGS